MRSTKKLAFICLLFFALTTLMVAFHHHDDGEEHEDCPICAAAHCVVIAETHTFLPEINQVISFVVVAEGKGPEGPFEKTLQGRSPPSSS